MTALMEDGPVGKLPSLGFVGVKKVTGTRRLCVPPQAGIYRERRIGNMQGR